MRHVNDREPNFRGDNGELYLVRCFSCGGDRGTENWAMVVAAGTCAWCGWTESSADDTTPRKRTDDNLRSVFG